MNPETTYIFKKGAGWVPCILDNVYYDRDNIPFYTQIVDLPNLGDVYVVLYEDQANPEWLTSHIGRYSFTENEQNLRFTELEQRYYQNRGFKFAVLTRV